jgi:preprotein translocase subunit SecE
MFYLIEDLIDEIRYNPKAQAIATVIAVVVAVAMFVTFLAVADPSPSYHIYFNN